MHVGIPRFPNMTPCGAPQTMVPSREEVRGEGARGISEKEKTGEFWAGQGLVRSGIFYSGPQLPRPPPRLRLVHADIPACPILGGRPQRPVRRLSGVVLPAEANGPRRCAETLSWQRESPDPTPTTTSSAP